MKYRVKARCVVVKILIVEADSEEEAEIKAKSFDYLEEYEDHGEEQTIIEVEEDA